MTPHLTAPTVPLAVQLCFAPDLQVTILADGTPRATHAFHDRSTTSGGMTSPSEIEIMDVIPDDSATVGL